MLLSKKCQSTAEYAITIGLVIAVVTGVLQVAVKKGITQKQNQALGALNRAGVSLAPDGITVPPDVLQDEDVNANIGQYTQSWRKTDIRASEDSSLMNKGGATGSASTQTTASNSVNIEMMENMDAQNNE